MKTFLFLIATLCAFNVTYGCSCLPMGNLYAREYINYSTIAIVEITEPYTQGSTNFARTKVQYSFKGDLKKGDALVVNTEMDGCGVTLRQGDIWFIFDPGISLCTRDFSIRRSDDNMESIPIGELGEWVNKSPMVDKLRDFEKFPTVSGFVKTEEGELVEGKKNGVWRIFEKNYVGKCPEMVGGPQISHPIETITYRDNQFHGLFIEYWCNHEPKHIWNYRMGTKIGWQKSYYYSGKIEKEYYNNERGETIEKLEYDRDGKQISHWVKEEEKK